MSEKLWCPKCESESYVKNGKVGGKQRYKCKQCGCNFTQSHAHGKPRLVKMFALMLYLSGMSMNAISKVVGVSDVSVMKWIKKFGNEFDLPEGYGEVVEVEIDEMWHYLSSKKTNTGSGELLNIRLKGFSGCIVVSGTNEK